MSTMKQAVITSPTTFRVDHVARPTPQSHDDVILRTAVSGICSGDLMEWYLAKKVGTVLGHEVVGFAEQVGDDVTHIEKGNLVFVHHHAPCMACRFCLLRQFVQCETWKKTFIDPGGMAEFVRVPADNCRYDTFDISDVSPDIGVFIEPLACSVKSLQMVDHREADLGIVVGCGIMGLLNIQMARALGTKIVWAIEPDASRRAKALDVGAQRALTPEEMREELAGKKFAGADYVVVGPGFPPVIEEATKYVRGGGSVLLFTPTAAGVKTSLDLGELYFREIRLLPSYSCGPTDTRRAYDLLRTGRVDPRPIITHRFSIDDIQPAYDTAKKGGSALKVLIEFPFS
ncbi:alcohol dehydrogenase catalytic domain-containing protein [bacterium]|nr:alcohol dehydrogenase catalytic domain-containing protein [bacterium]